MAKEMIKKTETTTVSSKKKFEQSDGIMCRSIVQGGLVFKGAKTDMEYLFDSYGDECEIEYRDLIAAVRTKNKAVFNPWFVIEDEDFIDEFPVLKDFYTRQYTQKDLESIFDLPVSQMISTIKTLPNTVLDTIKVMASVKVGNGSLDSVKKIKALDEYFGTDLQLISQIVSE